jgi:hypothetical protein
MKDLSDEDPLKQSKRPFRQMSFKMKRTTFWMNVFYNETNDLSDEGPLKQSERPFG